MRAVMLAAMTAALACGGGAAGDAAPEAVPPAAVADAGSAPADAEEPRTSCCRLDNERGERLDYKCGVAIDTSYLADRGYRCWIAE